MTPRGGGKARVCINGPERTQLTHLRSVGGDHERTTKGQPWLSPASDFLG